MNKKILILIIFVFSISSFCSEEVSFLDNSGTLDSRTESFKNNEVFKERTVDFSGYSFKFALVTFIVVASIIVIMFYLNKKKVFDTGTDIRILENVQLGPGKNVYLLMIPGEILIIGATNNSINVLSKIDDLDIINDIKERNSSKPVNFKEMLLVNSLDSLMPKKKKK
ncbi:MAG: flagellar biosynthetic protein FliO [Candidatus Muirbacterium halophilum]|nr:flagellar biosynthetic protein FliO [Candidatus Muirbacterium halophilum]